MFKQYTPLWVISAQNISRLTCRLLQYTHLSMTSKLQLERAMTMDIINYYTWLHNASKALQQVFACMQWIGDLASKTTAKAGTCNVLIMEKLARSFMDSTNVSLHQNSLHSS